MANHQIDPYSCLVHLFKSNRFNLKNCLLFDAESRPEFGLELAGKGL